EDQGVQAEAATDIDHPAGEQGASEEHDSWAAAPAELHYDTLTDLAGLQQFCKELGKTARVALFPVVEDGHYRQAPLVGLALAITPGRAAYLPFGHDMMGASAQLPLDEALQVLKPFLEDKALFKVGHDLKHCTHVFRRYDINLRGRRYDVMLQSYVLNSVLHRHNLERICEQHLDETLQSVDELRGKGRNRLAFGQLAVAPISACVPMPCWPPSSMRLPRWLRCTATSKLHSCQCWRAWKTPASRSMSGRSPCRVRNLANVWLSWSAKPSSKPAKNSTSVHP